MNQENDRPKSRKLSDVAFHATCGGVMLLISIPLTLGLLLEEKPPDWTTGDTGFAVALLCVCWGLTVSFLASCFRRPWLQKFGNAGITFAILLFVAFLIAVWLRPDIESGEMPPIRATVLGSVLLFNSIIGLLLFLSARGSAGSPAKNADDIMASPLMIVLWPLLLFGVSPVGGLLYLMIVGGTAYLGAWIGGKFFHPLLGAIGLTGGLLMLLGIVMFFTCRKTKPASQGSKQQDESNRYRCRHPDRLRHHQ